MTKGAFFFVLFHKKSGTSEVCIIYLDKLLKKSRLRR